jgi:hypothetical protein
MAEDEGRIMGFLCNYIGKQASQVPVPLLALFSSFEPVSPVVISRAFFFFRSGKRKSSANHYWGYSRSISGLVILSGLMTMLLRFEAVQ